MTTRVYVSQLPRPWYVSLTAVWQDDKKNHAKLDKLLKRRTAVSGKDRKYPAAQPAGNHVPMPRHCRHFTVLAIMKLNGHPDDPDAPWNMQKFASDVFEAIQDDKAILEKLQERFKAFTANVWELRCFDDGMTLQFECGKTLEEFRNHARKVLEPRVSKLVRQHTNSEAGQRFKKQWDVPLVESILDDKKNRGTEAFGSVARSPCRSDGSTERWREPLKGVCLEFKKIHLLVSDEMLTNPRSREEDVLIRAVKERGRRAGGKKRFGKRSLRGPRR